MLKEELMKYGKFVDNDLTEISSIMWFMFKVISFLGRKINHKLAINYREIAYGNKNQLCII
jgi:hypothetical protein